MSTPVKVTAYISGEALDVLRQMAGRRSTTMTEVLRQAIGSEYYFQQQRAAGNKILLERADGTWHQVLFDR